MAASDELKKNTGHDSQGACLEDKLTGGKPPVISSSDSDPMYIQQLREVILPPIQNVVQTCKQITILILHQDSSRLATLLKFIYASK
jgi:hypothetical protein